MNKTSGLSKDIHKKVTQAASEQPLLLSCTLNLIDKNYYLLPFTEVWAKICLGG